MSNYTPQKTMAVIAYPCPNLRYKLVKWVPGIDSMNSGGTTIIRGLDHPCQLIIRLLSCDWPHCQPRGPRHLDPSRNGVMIILIKWFDWLFEAWRRIRLDWAKLFRVKWQYWYRPTCFWISMATVKSSWLLLMAWRRIGARPSATTMMT